MLDSQTQRIDLSSLNDGLPGLAQKKKSVLDLYAVGPDNFFADSHPGFVRKKNEDSYACCTRADGSSMFAMVADGIGGQSHGDLASRLCSQYMISAWRKFSGTPDFSEAMAEEFLYTEIEKSNQKIYSYASAHNFSAPMGTTIASLMFVRKKVITAHAGDSRIYRLRDGALERLTKDHSIISQMIEHGDITEDQAQNHPLAHVISKSVGATPFADPELASFDHFPGDCYLLCSDGLTLHVSDEEIREILSRTFDPEQAVNQLLGLVLRRGANDNVTIIVIFA